jgi:hypothetical protein
MQVAYAQVRLEILEVKRLLPGNQQLSPKPWKIAVGTAAPGNKISVDPEKVEVTQRMSPKVVAVVTELTLGANL